MIDATRFRELITALRSAETNVTPGRHALLYRLEGELFVFCNNNAEELLSLVEESGWRDISECPPHKRIIAAGWQPPSGRVVGYWWMHEDVADENGRPVDRPMAAKFRPFPPAPETAP